MTLINRNLWSLDLWSKNLGQGYTLPTSTMSIKYAKTEPLGEKNLVWTRNLQKSSVLTLTGNLKHWFKVNAHQFKPREREQYASDKVFQTQIYLTLLLDLETLFNVSLYSLPKGISWVKYDPNWTNGTENIFLSSYIPGTDKLMPLEVQDYYIIHNHGTFNNIVLERFLLIIGTQRIFYCYKYFKHKCYI